MQLRADFSQRAIVTPSPELWVASPASGVERLMLDRVGGEVARATSIVRYAAGSSFERHSHAMGEEFLVLEGVFSDESGNYGKGCYVRNPPGSAHAPFSHAGCRILVKLRQFEAQDLGRVAIDTSDRAVWPECAQCLELHAFGTERVSMHRVRAGAEFEIGSRAGGAEVFVVRGDLRLGSVGLGREAWLRLPPDDTATLVAASDSVLYLKTGHIALAGHDA